MDEVHKALQEKLDALNKELEGKFESKDAAKEVAKQIDEIQSKLNEVEGFASKEEMENFKEDNEKAIKELKDIVEEQGKTIESQKRVIETKATKGFKEALKTSLEKGMAAPEYKTFMEKAKNGQASGSYSIPLSKDVSLGTGHSGTTEMSSAIASGVVVDTEETLLARRSFISSMIPNGSTGGEATVHFDEYYDYEDNVAMLGENTDLAESSFKTREKSEGAKRLGTEIMISRRMLNAIDYVQGRVLNTLPRKMMYLKDSQVINGNPTVNSNDLQGFYTAGNRRSFTDEIQQTLVAGNITSVENIGGFAAINLATTIDPLIHKDYLITIAGATAGTYNAQHTVTRFIGRRKLLLSIPYVAEADTSAWTAVADHPLRGTFDDANYKDVLSAAKLNLHFAEYMADTCIMNPYDKEILAETKGSDGHYIFNANKPMMINDMPIMTSNAIPRGTALVIDMANASQLWTVDGLSLNIITGATDASLGRSNKVSFQIQGEYIHTIYNPLLILTVDLDAARNALDA